MLQPAKVLIVDSDPQMTAVLGLSLSYSEQKYEISSATSASKALLQLGIVLPDLIVLELTMPGGEGWDTLRRIRELSTMPVIALVDQKDPELCIKSLEYGADSCLVKPVSLLELAARVQALLRREQKLETADWLPRRLAA